MNDDTVTRRLTRLAEECDLVRAMVLTGSRANPASPRDVLSDYDVILYTLDVAPFVESETWFRELGAVLVSIQPGFEELGRWVCTRLVLYEDGTKIDFTVRSMDDLRTLCSTGTPPDDHGYVVLLDKDGLTAALGAPTQREYVPAVPTASDYAELVNSFWWESTYVSKSLWRDDLMAAKLMLDHHLKQSLLRPMLEWSIEIDRGWQWKPGAYGRGLAGELDADTGRELAATYAGGDIGDLWESLFRTTALFRTVAIRVAERLGYGYLYELDRKVTIYHQAVRSLDRQTASAADLAGLLREGYGGRRH